MLVPGMFANTIEEEILTIAPDLRSLMPGMRVCIARCGPRKLVSITLRESSSLKVSQNVSTTLSHLDAIATMVGAGENVRHRFKSSANADTGVVDQNIDPAVFLLERADIILKRHTSDIQGLEGAAQFLDISCGIRVF
jgi:hypothetical protein